MSVLSNSVRSALAPKGEVSPNVRQFGTGNRSSVRSTGNRLSVRGASASQQTEGGGFLSVVVLGASGDQAKRNTFPALFNLFKQGFLPSNQMRVVGYARSKLTNEELHKRLRGFLDESDPAVLSDFLNLVTYTSGGYDSVEGFQNLEQEISSHENMHAGETPGSARRIFYMAVPPSVYPIASKMIQENNMNAHGWTRVILEKPFGKDLDSSEELGVHLDKLFTEEQIYRIDHYLGKEIVQNLLVMRFANWFFMAMWNRDNIANIQIVCSEDFGIEGRGGYFDEYGIIRDVIQNHLLQIFSLIAMERPSSLSGDHVRDEKVKLLKAVKEIQDEDVVLGQYQGYKDDPDVPDNSNTPTFAQLIMYVNNERWDGVPFILKAGKGLDTNNAEIRVRFKDVPGEIFECKPQSRNEFVMRFEPLESMCLTLTVKTPGLEMSAIQSELDLTYSQKYEDVVIPEAYQRLLLDAVEGDQQHFVRRDELQEAWKIFTPLLHRIDQGLLKSMEYEQGTPGPKHANELLSKNRYA